MYLPSASARLSAVLMAVALGTPVASFARVSAVERTRATATLTTAMGCRLNASDLAAKSIARQAEIGALTMATEYNGSYSRVSLETIREVERTIPLTHKAAVRAHMSAYLALASGTRSTFRVTARAFDGNSYSIIRTPASSGPNKRVAVQCGHEYPW